MEDNIREVLYEKTAEKLTIEDRNYLNDIIYRNYQVKAAKGLALGSILAVVLTVFGIQIASNVYSPTLTYISYGVGLGFAGAMGLPTYFSASSLKKLGLTSKDWRELQKSNRIAKLKEIVEDYDQQYYKEVNEKIDGVVENTNKKTYKVKARLKETKLVNKLAGDRDHSKSGVEESAD